jgi:Family of unknown function (DUF6049)
VLRTIAGCGFAVAIALAAAAPVPAAAQALSGAAPALVLAGQSPWVPLGGIFTMRLQGTNVSPGSTVAITVHDAVDSRTAFDQSVSGGALPPTRDLVRVPYDTLPADPATGDRVVALPVADLTTGGVYPLEVDLRDAAGESVSNFVTHAVVAQLTADGHLAVGVPLDVAWVWPLASEPAYLGTGPGPNPATVTDLAPSGRLGRQAAQLGADTDVPVTLAPSAETLDAWETLSLKFGELAPGVSSLRAAAQRDQVLAGPFVPLDLPSVLASGLGGVIDDELGRGVTTLEQFFGTHLDPSVALPGPLDATSLRLLEVASVRQLVVPAASLTPADEKFTPAHPYKLQGAADDTASVSVLASDGGFERFLTGDDPPALRAAHLLSGLALVAFEQPSVTRGVTFVNPPKWDADDTFVAATLAGLRENPLLQPLTVSDLFAAVPTATAGGAPDGAEVVRGLTPYSPPAAPVTRATYDRASTDQQQLQALVGVGDPRAVRGDRALASSTAAAWANPRGRKQARSLLAAIGTTLDQARTELTSQVAVQPRTTVTITSSRAQIPIGLKNLSDHQVTVHVALESDRLLFPDGAERDVTLPARRNTTVRVAVETRSSGRSPMQVTVTTAGGLAVTPPGGLRIIVRSSFVSGVGVFLTVGAVVFLAVWWGWDIRRRRKGRGGSKPRPTVLTPSGQTA